MHRNPIVRGIKFALFAIIACIVLMPPIFGWHTITFWQGLGLFLLSKLLFGGFHRHGGGRNRWRQHMKDRWEHMTPEDREKFRNGMRCGRGPFASPVEPQI
jgi:hypothetical protein